MVKVDEAFKNIEKFNKQLSELYHVNQIIPDNVEITLFAKVHQVNYRDTESGETLDHAVPLSGEDSLVFDMERTWGEFYDQQRKNILRMRRIWEDFLPKEKENDT